MIGSYATSKYTFDLHPEDVYFCTADCGWITGRKAVVVVVPKLGRCCACFKEVNLTGFFRVHKLDPR